MDRRTTVFARGLLIHVVGALLVFAGIALAAMTARGLMDYAAVAGSHGGEMIDLGHEARPLAGQHGYMARVVGTPTVVEAPHDPEFNLQVKTPVLVRHVEMFQWREVHIGDNVHYELDWVDRPLDARRFKRPSGHANPGSFPIDGRQFDAGLVRLGGFRLSPLLLHALPGTAMVTPDLKSLPENLAASFSLWEGYLVTSAHPGSPRLGDIRVSWNEVPLQPMTIVARLDGDQLVPAADAADGKGYEVQVGEVSLYGMFPDLPAAPEFVWFRQILSVLLAVLGVLLLLEGRRHQRDVWLALALGALLVGLVSCVLWLGGGNGRFVTGWLLVALGGFAVTLWRLRRQMLHR